jgi:hypothetical protein
MTQGEMILRNLEYRFKTHGNVFDALIGELTYLVLEGSEDGEVDRETVVEALRWSIEEAIEDRRRCGGNNRGWPPPGTHWFTTEGGRDA